jgi:hypothetical protein
MRNREQRRKRQGDGTSEARRSGGSREQEDVAFPQLVIAFQCFAMWSPARQASASIVFVGL